MKKVPVKASKRKGKVVKAHTRTVKGGNTAFSPKQLEYAKKAIQFHEDMRRNGFDSWGVEQRNEALKSGKFKDINHAMSVVGGKTKKVPSLASRYKTAKKNLQKSGLWSHDN